MEPTAYAGSASFLGIQVPQVRKSGNHGSVFGQLALIGFVIVQCLDGVMTYLGVSIYGAGIEANPLLASLISHWGELPALAAAKTSAVGLGFWLHLFHVDSAIAWLTGVYFVAAVLPWTMLLFF